jgi:hypothetical protein
MTHMMRSDMVELFIPMLGLFAGIAENTLHAHRQEFCIILYLSILLHCGVVFYISKIPYIIQQLLYKNTKNTFKH